MKRILFILGLLLTSILPSLAQIRAPLITCLKDAQVVCIARVISLKQGVYTFSVTANLRGTAPKVISGKGFVQTPDDNAQFPVNSEWVLMSHGPMEKWSRDISIGGDMEDWGYGNWGPTPLRTIQGETYVSWHYSMPNDTVTYDKDFGTGEKVLTLEHFRSLLSQNPYKS